MTLHRYFLYIIFKIVGVAVFVLSQRYAYTSLVHWLRGWKKNFRIAHAAVTALFVLFNLPLITFFLPLSLFEYVDGKIFHVIAYPFYVWQFAIFLTVLTLAAIKLFRMAAKRLYRVFARHAAVKKTIAVLKTTSSFQKFDASRRAFLRTGIVGISAYSFAGAARGIFERNQYEIIERKIRIKNLPEEFKGFTIGLMSDVHSSAFMTKSEMDEYVAALNALKTDLVVVPGDFVNSMTEEVYPFAEAFASLHAPHGVYGCLGNHDYYADVDVVAKVVDDCGVKLLRNDAVKIQKGNSFFNLIGVDDIRHRIDPNTYIESALSSAHNDQPKILLCHRPYFLETIDNYNIDLTLAGHTHGGQIVLAHVGDIYLTPAALVSKYICGLYRVNGSQMYVTRGIGTVGVPLRINCPPEITKITLV
ncbi:MAG: metallophosphoesterase [Bacteroidota bacterium]|nr:metallophosphoesterase [Bacteroidota bacterium]